MSFEISIYNLLDCSHEKIHIKWITNLNDNSMMLSFVYYGEQIHAEQKSNPVDHEIWASLLSRVKAECTGKGNSPLSMVFLVIVIAYLKLLVSIFR